MEADLRRHRDELEAQVASARANSCSRTRRWWTRARFNHELTDAIPGLVTYWDAELRCRFANRTYLDWFHRSAEQVIGLTRAEIFGQRARGRGQGSAAAGA